ncbi:hypothetical protein K491DRAFT_665912 [Lophiostoma macrostomum CBS 122681]|uniref:Nuclear pore complex component n=1 Tax=Lophiostoma macrostomum CBS 122681 TaxID=1314788 RepID=A0A6A6SUM3_9PLEO|nr:hypothetical protein K491DRAFT_665912 [Lophiostoma macrostomum CBS 122681]
MATPRTPAMPVTPAAQKVQQPTPTGRWKHPKFDDITRRQQSTTFDERNVQAIVLNGAVLIFSLAAFNSVPNVALLRVLQYASNPPVLPINYLPFADCLLWAVRFVFLANIVQAFLPLARRYSPDDMADIPLTPSQRSAMGLDPNVSTPQTPGSAYASPNYITPPRYQRSTPRNSFGTPVERQSPLSGSPRGIDTFGKSTSNSPFSPNTGSPLFRGAVSGSASKRLSFDGRGSPLANSSLFMESSSSNAPSTPTPSNGKASVGLNNKWLYEKRRDSPRSSLFA